MAATAALINGSDLIVKFGATGSGETEIAYGTSCSLEVSRDEIDQSNKNSGAWKSIIPGMRSWTLSAEALYFIGTPAAPYATMGTAESMYAAFLNDATNTAEVFIEFTLRTRDAADKYYSGKAIITSFSLSGGVEDQATFSVSLSGNGELTLAA